MLQRPIATSGLTTSEIGFDVHGCAADDARSALREALNLGVNLLLTTHADDGEHSGESLIGDELGGGDRSDVVVATTLGCAELPESADALHEHVMRSLERSLDRLKRDHIDMWQLQLPTMRQMHDDALWNLLGELRRQGVVRAIGPCFDWKTPDQRTTALHAIEHRDIDFVVHRWNMLEQQPGGELTEAAAERDIALIVRDPHARGLLEDQLDEYTTFDVDVQPGDLDRQWFDDGRRMVDSLRFLLDDRDDATLAQLAVKWTLVDPAVASVVPDIRNLDQLRDMVAATEIDEFDADEIGEVITLHHLNFGLDAAVAMAGAAHGSAGPA